jgi:serine/threonine protein kinase
MDEPVKIGEVIADKYLVERVLGKGGMGIVYLAKHLQLGERVAIKLLKTRTLKNAELVARFLREGRTAARLRSEYVARVRDVGTLPSGAPYLVMEYLDGRDFEAVLAEHGALDTKVAVKYLLQACEALAEAHAMGIVHRDLKPANLILIRKRDGTTAIKIIDFGISKLVSSEAPGPGMTQDSVMMGSPLYMAPEQMTSARDADARSDVFSLGAILYHLLTNTPPFLGNSAVDVFERISLGPPSPRTVRPDLPAGIEAVTSRCLRKIPGERFADVAELAAALAPFGPPHAELFAESAERILRASADTNAASSPVAPSGMATPSPVGASARPPARASAPPPPEPIFDLADPVPRTTQKKAPPARSPAPPPAPAERARPAEPRNLLDELFEMEKERPRAPDAGASESPPRGAPLSLPPPSAPPHSASPRSAPSAPSPPASYPVVAPAVDGPLDSLPPPPALPAGSPLGKADRAAAEAVLDAVREALSGFGLAGTVALEGKMLTLRGNGLPTSIDAGPAAEQWPLLPVDMQRRKALDLARRLAEAHRTAQRARSGLDGGGESSPPWVLIGKALLGLGAAAALVVGGRAYLESRSKAALPPPVPAESAEQQSRRLATACRAVRERVYSGATIGPFDTTGWVVELWLASRPGPLPGAAASKPITASSMAGAIATGHLAPSLDDTLARLTEGTLALDEAAIPATSPGWTGVTLRFGGGYARAFFEPEPRSRFLAVADRLFESSGADLGALYARCADSPVHDVGAWFRGRDPGAAATALLYGMSLFAERPQINRAALGPAELDGLRASATAAKLDAPTLKGLIGEHGGSLAAAPGAVTLAFPLGGPVRAVRASHAVAVKLGIGRE